MIGKFWYAAALLSLAAPAFGETVLSCDSPDGRYHVDVNDDALEGEVRIDGSLPQFGQLQCSHSQNGYSCWSKNVADAGYSVWLRRNGARHAGAVSEVSFTGERQLATLECNQ